VRGSEVVHRFVAVANLPSIEVGGSGTYGARGFTFQLNDVPEYAAFVGLFDEYRITKIDLTFEPTSTVNSAQSAIQLTSTSAPAIFNPLLHTAIDYGVVAPPSAPSDLYAYSSYRRNNMKGSFTITLRPRVALACEPTGTILPAPTGLTSSPGVWLSTQYPAVAHSGVRAICDIMTFTSTNVTQYNVRVFARYHLEFRNVV